MRAIPAFLIALTMAVASAAAPATAEPPAWAPAHGWRAKHGHLHDHHRHRYEHRYRYEQRYRDEYRYRDEHRHHTRRGDWTGGRTSGPDPLRCRRELAGQVAGGAIGAIVGSNIGDGRGQLVAIGTGALIGVLVGGQIGSHLDRSDRACLRGSLEHVRSGRSVAWRNPDTGAHYRTTPVSTYRTQAGRYCREYTTTATVGGRRQQVYGTACRQPDGDWELQN